MSGFLNSRHTRIYRTSLELIMADKLIFLSVSSNKKTQYFGETGRKYLLSWQLWSHSLIAKRISVELIEA